MPKIVLETLINASIDICFDLSRSIDLHKISTAKTQEIATEGVTSGLISLNEFVTWEATHFGIRQQLTTKITAYKKPTHFKDEQVKGIFKFIIHDHYFEMKDNKTIMKDVFYFQSPFGFIGKIFDKLILKNYLTKFLIQRNNMIKQYAETDQWKMLL